MAETPSFAHEHAVSLLQAGKPGEVAALLAPACRAELADGETWHLYGTALHQLGLKADALIAYDKAISLCPDDVVACSMKAAVLFELNRQDEALVLCSHLLAKPNLTPVPLYNIAYLLDELGQAELAHAGYRAVLDRHPGFLPASLNLYALLARTGKLVEACAVVEKAVDLNPDDADCWFYLGDIRFAANRSSDALTAFERALSLHPESGKARMGRGLALAALGRLEEASAAFATAQKNGEAVRFKSPLISDYEDPSFAMDPRRIYCNTQFIRLTVADWSRRDEFKRELERLIDSPDGFTSPLSDRSLPHAALALQIPPAHRFRLARQVSDGVAVEAQRINLSISGVVSHAANGVHVLNIGYVSPDFRDHATAHLTRQLYRCHDRGRFRVHGYALSPLDGSSVAQAIASSCDVFFEGAAVGSADLARRIRADGIHILVDLAGYTRLARPEVFAARCAALQVGYLGYPGTLGGRALDYALIDEIVCPAGSEAHWSEKLLCLPGTYAIYDDQAAAAATLRRCDVGLPREGTVLCCFNSAWKISPELFGVWMRLLYRLPGSCLWLYGDDAALQANLREVARRHGIGGERLVFAPHVPHEFHLARYPLADIFLDTLPCNAHTTAADALWMGVPVVTCPGPEMHGRVAASLLRAAGLPELITANLDEYEALAYRLATEPGVLSGLRETLAARRRSGELFNTRRKVRDLERAYEMIWERHCVGLPPAALDVPAED